MKSKQPKRGWTARILLLAVLALCLAGVLFFLLEPGLELGAQNKRWTAASHDRTNFPLLGRHRSVPCGDCHLNGVIAGTPSACEACHWDRRRDDRYQLLLGDHCADCHTPFDWKKLKPNSWEHGRVSGFPLAGVHKTMDCAACHPGNVFKGQAQDCYSCHRRQYEQAPNHVSGGYATDCRQCHFSMISWTGGQTDHSLFPLLGRHAAAACADCHKNNVYAGTAQDCASCHLEDYNATLSPNHKQAGFSTDCVSCHGTSAQTWNNAAVNHDLYWQLQGAHRTLECNQCHASGYDLPRDCYSCHKTDYDNTRDPNHRQAGYSTACENCHLASHTSWNQAVFTHKFPINSGRHSGLACTDCHRTSSYLVFSCIDCHEHSKSEMDDKHDDVSGYSYNSQACYACHPNGSAGGGSGARVRR
ncbi:MAG: hypothetical protein E4H23_04235 [Chrysiogenales bacterium]|nr:MAG: hypothetical protein E4H23_04235 [Chrysiogenales bacterium]